MIFTSWMIYILFLYWVETGIIFKSAGTMAVVFNSPVFYLNFLLSTVIIFIIDHTTYFLQFFLKKNLTKALRIFVNNKESKFTDEIVDSLNTYKMFLNQKNKFEYTKIVHNKEHYEDDKIKKISLGKNSSINIKSNQVSIKEENGRIEENYLIFLKNDN